MHDFDTVLLFMLCDRIEKRMLLLESYLCLLMNGTRRMLVNHLKAAETLWRRFTRLGAVCADLSEIQRDLMDMNMRYDGVEERLANREKELQDMLDNVKVYLQVRGHLRSH